MRTGCREITRDDAVSGASDSRVLPTPRSEGSVGGHSHRDPEAELAVWRRWSARNCDPTGWSLGNEHPDLIFSLP